MVSTTGHHWGVDSSNVFLTDQARRSEVSFRLLSKTYFGVPTLWLREFGTAHVVRTEKKLTLFWIQRIILSLPASVPGTLSL
jgi:hypothetical protein